MFPSEKADGGPHVEQPYTRERPSLCQGVGREHSPLPGQGHRCPSGRGHTPTSGRCPLATHNGVLLQHRALQVTLFPEFSSNQQSYLQQADPPNPESAPAPVLLPVSRDSIPLHLDFQLNKSINPTAAPPPPRHSHHGRVLK